MRRLVWLASLVVVAVAAVAVPMPFQRTIPGNAVPVEDLVTVAEGGEVNGDLQLLTIRDVDANVLDVLVAAVRDGQQLTPVSETLPPGIDDRVMREILAQQFANSFTTAVAVAAESVGHEVEVDTEVVVTQVLADGASAGVLEAGDHIRAIDGRAVASAGELVAALGPREEGETVTLEVDRDGAAEPLLLDIVLRVLPTTGNPGLGIVPQTLTAPVDLPFDVQLGQTNIIGPSAGLMIAVTVADVLDEDDLAAGRVIAGTGTIDGVGAVGVVGGIEQKVETAVEERAELLLVPADQAQAAVAAADGRIEVVGVATLEEALDVLRGPPDDG